LRLTPLLLFQFDQLSALFAPPPKSHCDGWVVGQVNTSGTIS
jgi:hypothetical protein